MKKYEGNYDTFETPVRSWSLIKVQRLIEQAGGYDPEDRHGDFEAYTTAWINEFNLVGRTTAHYYFSLSYRKWIRTTNKLTLYRSWNTALKPIKAIAQWLLRLHAYSVMGWKTPKAIVVHYLYHNIDLHKTPGTP